MRQNIIALICGKRNCGKSTLINNLLLKYKSNRVMVYDTDGNKVFSNYKEISLNENWRSLKKGLYKCSDPNFEAFFAKVYAEFSNGVLALDDLRKYAGANGQLPQSLRQLCIVSKQRNLDIFCSQHSFTQIIKQLHVYADVYIFFDFNGEIENTAEISDIHQDLAAMLIYVKEQAKTDPHTFAVLQRGKPFSKPSKNKKI